MEWREAGRKEGQTALPATSILSLLLKLCPTMECRGALLSPLPGAAGPRSHPVLPPADFTLQRDWCSDSLSSKLYINCASRKVLKITSRTMQSADKCRLGEFTQLAQQKTWPRFPAKLEREPAASKPHCRQVNVVLTIVCNQETLSVLKLDFSLKNDQKFYLGLLLLKEINTTVQSFAFY